jgi:hypothetical protein
MNILKITLCISVFLFTPAAFALGDQENSKVGTHTQMPVLNQATFHQENHVGASATTEVVHHQIMTQSPIETRDASFFTKLCIFLIISMVYWIYWLINTRTCKMKP